ncbi:MAG TPA: DUF4276 family protein [Desulfosporosinus sp.]|nr:DUF4276 family protein [Desulfosporosinus sp.]
MKLIVFLVEEPSMKEFLKVILPRVIPENVSYKIIHHEGKQDLERSIPKKLRAFRQPETRFVILIDQDSNDCLLLKNHLLGLCQEGGREDCLVRIVCHELESWFLGDLEAVGQAYNLNTLARRQGEAKYRQPDRLSNAAQVLKLLVPTYQKVSGARAVSKHMKLSENESYSFAVFIKGLQEVIGD